MSNCCKVLKGHWHKLFATAVFSFVMGIVSGWSNSPVISPLLTGVFGAATVLCLLFITNQLPDSGEKKRRLSPKGSLLLSYCVCAFSIFLCLGTILGVAIRTNGFREYREDQLAEISELVKKDDSLSVDSLAFIVLTQRSLRNSGVSNVDNNLVISKLIETQKAKSLKSDKVGELESVCGDLAKISEWISYNLESVDKSKWKDGFQPVPGAKSFDDIRTYDEFAEVVRRQPHEKMEELRGPLVACINQLEDAKNANTALETMKWVIEKLGAGSFDRGRSPEKVLGPMQK